MSDQDNIFAGQKVTQIFPITVGGLPDLSRKPQQLTFPYTPLLAYKGQENFTNTYNAVTIKSSNQNPVLGDVVPGDYIIEYTKYGLDSEGNQFETYYPTQPNDRIFVQAGVRTAGLDNNQFIDSSTNDTSINNIGITAQGSKSPYEENLSAEFSGSNSRVIISANDSLSPGDNDFTVEGWVKPVNESFYLIKSDQPYNFNLGYNLDSAEQGLVLGLENDITTVTFEKVETVNLDTDPFFTVALDTDKIIFIADIAGSEDASYEISGISSQEIGGVDQFGEMLQGLVVRVSLFPESYQTQIDNFAGDKRYVDIENGVDGNDGLTSASAWKTFNYAVSQTAATTTPVMLIFLPGEYPVSSTIVPGFSDIFETAFFDSGFHREIVCAPGQVTFKWIANGPRRDAPLVFLVNQNSKIHGAIIERDNFGRTLTYSVSFFAGFGSRGILRNCVFREVNANNLWSLHYDNNNNFPILIDQCVFFVLANGLAPWSGGPGIDIRNSVFTRLTGSSITLTNSLTNATVNAITYRTPAATNQGTYFGLFSWEEEVNEIDVFKLEVPLTSRIKVIDEFTFTVIRSGVETSTVISIGASSTSNLAGNLLFDSPGTYSWTVPDGVTSISAVAVGGGGASSRGNSGDGGGGGGSGGSLGYVNNLSVTPGETLTIVVGAGGQSAVNFGQKGGDGGFSRISRETTHFVTAPGGLGGNVYSTNPGAQPPAGPSFSGTGSSQTGGGAGGGGGGGYNGGGGGGGAGGYNGVGGNGSGSISSVLYTSGFNAVGIGGGGGGGASFAAGAGLSGGGNGGAGQNDRTGGGGGGAWLGFIGVTTNGSDGNNSTSTPSIGGKGGFPGGGSGGGYDNGTSISTEGADGAVRISWGTDSQFPPIADVPVDSSNSFASGGTETEITINSINYKVHTFTTSSTFVVNNNIDVEYLVVAGGGAGGGHSGQSAQGGGGAGGYRSSVIGELSGENSNVEPIMTLSPGFYTVVVGAGGTGLVGTGNRGNNSLFHTIESIGGGAGGNHNTAGTAGGSGGGGGGRTAAPGGAGTPGQGFNGGASTSSGTASHDSGGGGGGAGESGANANINNGGKGGNGILSSITGTATYYAGGGGGGAETGTGGAGGLGGGAPGRGNVTASGLPADANTGGGGGGAAQPSTSSTVGGNGGSGIVIVRYRLPDLNAITGPTQAILGENLEYTIVLDPDLGVANGVEIPYTITGIDAASLPNSSLTGNTLIFNNRSTILLKTVAVGTSSIMTISVNVPGLGTISTTTELEMVDNVQAESSGGEKSTVSINNTNYKIHTFLSSDIFTVVKPLNVDYLIVGGGGGGGNINDGGGGGAGGAIYTSASLINPGSYAITIGAGGALGINGQPSSAFGDIAGGGIAASVTSVGPGGASGAPQNNPGGAGGGFATDGGGGGGAGSAGFAAGLDGIGPGRGGIGLFFGNEFSSNVGDNGWFASGGGGGGETGSPPRQLGGGGTGGQGTEQTDRDGLPNTGGGGGGNNDASPFSNTSRNAGAGGSGVVIVRYIDDFVELPVGLSGANVALWGDTLEYIFKNDELPDGTLITYSIANLNGEDLVSGVVPSAAAFLKNGLAKIKLATVDTQTSIKSITIVILNVNNPDGTSITFTTNIQPKLKLVTNSFFNLNQWNHFAISRSASNLGIYINGQRKLLANIGSYNFSNDVTRLIIGGPDKVFQGRLADVRIVSQEARYTQSIEPVPENRLLPRTGTKLLTFKRSVDLTNIFQDLSVEQQEITSVGVINVYDTPVSFRPYTPNQNFGSAYFVSDSYLTIPNSPSFNFGSDNFTIELWIKTTTVALNNQTIAALYGYTNDRRSWSLHLRDADFEIRYSSLGTTVTIIRSSPVFTANKWHHVAYVRNGTEIFGYVDGKLVVNGVFSDPLFNNTVDPVSIGTAGPTYTDFYNGYIADLRIVKGVAVYTNPFTPPINPLETTAETVLHLKFDNAKVYDEIRNQNIGFINGAVTSTSVINEKQFSIDCTGTKYITVSLPPPARLNMAGTDRWSLEFSFLNTGLTTNTAVATYGRITTWTPWLFWISANSLRFYSSSNNSSWNIASDVVIIPTMNINTWYKIRLTRTSQGYQTYVNGSLISTHTNTGNFFTPSNNFLAFGATTSGATPSSIYVEGITIWNNTQDPEPVNILGPQIINKFVSHTYPDGFFDNAELDFEVKYLPSTLGISSSRPKTQIISPGVVQPIISYRTQTRLQFVVGPDGNITLVDTTPGNDPTIDRNPRPEGDTGPVTPRRIWY